MSNSTGPVEPEAKSRAEWASIVIAWIVFVAMVLVVILFGSLVVRKDAAFWDDILKDHIAAIVGLQAAAALSFALVVFLRQVDGPIEFEGLGFKFKGAAGQVVMWIICFLAVTAAIKMSWSMK
jgi:hypothetical protein